MLIADYLLEGQENAIPRRRLMALTGLPDRAFRREIERERRDGIPILADNLTGYYLPSCEDERRRFVRSMRGRAFEILTTAAAIEKGAGA